MIVLFLRPNSFILYCLLSIQCNLVLTAVFVYALKLPFIRNMHFLEGRIHREFKFLLDSKMLFYWVYPNLLKVKTPE